MRLPSILNHNSSKSSGFTLTEILVVIGLFALLVSLGLILSMDVWRGTSFQSEEDLVLSLLYKARSKSLANINEANHGLCIDMVNRKYVVFEGNDCNASGIEFPMNDNFAFSEDELEIVFSARTAMVSETKTFTLTGQGKMANFTINEEGGITWEHPSPF